MQTEELNSKIMQITSTIQEEYPELLKYLDEMPVTIPNEKDPEINNKNLKAYYNSLTALLQNYIDEHPKKGVN